MSTSQAPKDKVDCTNIDPSGFSRQIYCSRYTKVETKLNSIQSKTSREITDTRSSVSTENTSSASAELFGSAANSHACKELGTEIAVILGGSENTKLDDFQSAKTSVLNMMKQKCAKIRFAVAQYGAQIQTEQSLQESWKRLIAFFKVQNIKQQSSRADITATLQHMLDKVFESHDSGQTDDKIIIVMAPGQVFLENYRLRNVMNSLEMAVVKLCPPEIGEFISNQVPEELQVGSDWFILSTYEDFDSFLSELERETLSDSASQLIPPKMAGIERYAIGVGDAFKKPKALNLLIASGPDDTNVSQVTNYSALDGLLSTLQRSIMGIEQVLLFSGGAFDWSGRILLYDLATKTTVFLNESKEAAKKAKYSYLMYGVAMVRTEYGPFYVAGAPWHSTRGKVVVFQDSHLKPALQGEQVGSYFGSELCPLDVNHDGVTDLLLVGAPFYHIRGEEGRVYVYRLETGTGSFTLKGRLNVQVISAFARFGFTVASIGDINRDGYEDIAVGAPLGDQLSNSSSFGSIYIFNGDKEKIKSSFSQRVKASEMSSGLQYFGQSIDGGFDFTNYGLQDITVGSLETVIVLHSRPVVHFLTSMRFNPERILIFKNNSIVTAKLCFNTISALPVSQQVLSQLYILYTVDLDVKMAKRRVQFEDQNTTTSGKLLVSKHMCPELQLYTLPCDFDCFSSVFLGVKHKPYKKNAKMEFAVPVLDRYQPSEMHFQKGISCGPH
ncbi:LOW QUALITY PROTEIN: integrin alpha-E [Pluvialis apricaria]